VLLDLNATDRSGPVQINLTPLIDVALVLVVTLLVMSSLAVESGFWVRAQAGASADAREVQATAPVPVKLSILSETEVQMENRRLHRSHLQPVLTAMLHQPGFAGVTVSCADKVSHAAFVDVLDQARLSGAASIAIADPSGR
jgi:biopolymer transport protein ExbD